MVEACLDIIKHVPEEIYCWMLAPHESDGPEDSGTVIANVKKNIVKKLPYIQSIAEKQGKKFIVSDSVSYLKASSVRSKDRKLFEC